MKTATLLKTMFVMILAVGLIGCGDDKKKRSAIGRKGRSTDVTSDIRNASDFQSSNTWPGSIVGTPQHLFQQATEGFVSAVIDPSSLGAVSGSDQDTTGVRFDGFVEVSGGFNPNSLNGNGSLASGSLKVLVWDEYAANGTDSGIKADKFTLGAGSSLNGSTARITFSDGLGEITFEGTIDSQWFYGQVWYDNNQYWDGRTPGDSWDWGNFFIPVCDFFKCN